MVDPTQEFTSSGAVAFGEQGVGMSAFSTVDGRNSRTRPLPVRKEPRLVSALRRIFDVGFSLVMIVLTLPIMAAAALAVLIDSPGPIFYRQNRVGLNGELFRITKFRSMRLDAEKAGSAVWASTDDPRVTRVGKLLRRYRVDELPQFFDVLTGSMSVVGPRPERPEFVLILRESIASYDHRHAVKPGITGLAQVRYSYGASVDDARVKHIYDMEYLQNRSLAMDGRILTETVAVVLFGKGAR